MSKNIYTVNIEGSPMDALAVFTDEDYDFVMENHHLRGEPDIMVDISTIQPVRLAVGGLLTHPDFKTLTSTPSGIWGVPYKPYECKIFGCEPIDKKAGEPLGIFEYKDKNTCLLHCDTHQQDIILGNLSPQEKIDFFNANSWYVDRKLTVEVDADGKEIEPDFAPLILTGVSFKQIRGFKFQVAPEMIGGLVLETNASVEVYNRSVDRLTNLFELTLGDVVTDPITLPEGLEVFKMGILYNQPIKLPEGLIKLIMGNDFNQPIELPASLRVFIMGSRFDQNITLPKGLSMLRTGYKFDKPITLPASLQEFIMGTGFNQPDIKLPDGLVVFKMGYNFDQPITLPDGLKVFWTGVKFKQPITLPDGLAEYNVGRIF